MVDQPLRDSRLAGELTADCREWARLDGVDCSPKKRWSALRSVAECTVALAVAAKVKMSGLESTHAFAERAGQIGMDPVFLQKVMDKSLDTFGKLAFVCSSRPASGDDAPLFKAVKDLIGEEVPPSQTMVLRRLWYEAHSHALVDLEARASRTSDTTPRELPLAERMARLKRQRNSLTGLELDVRTEPARCLVDRVQSMLDNSQVVHLPPEKCVSRQDEIELWPLIR